VLYLLCLLSSLISVLFLLCSLCAAMIFCLLISQKRPQNEGRFETPKIGHKK
jgi:hypothetical protein